jgi:hypothetical protein
VTRLLERALEALGPGPTRREVAQVAAVLRESGDRETLALFRPLDGSYFDHEACGAVTEVAEKAGAAGACRA